MALRARTPAERDAQTVEITFAVLSGALLGGGVFGLIALPLVFIGVSGAARATALEVATVCALAAATAWIIRVLRR